MAKKREATPEYKLELEHTLARAYDELLKAKTKLYAQTLEGKLFEPAFEQARLDCINVTTKITKAKAELERVESELAGEGDALF